jgi:histidinol phosphatase-like PHP family hydrolase
MTPTTPVPPERTDYHVHGHFDGCAAKTMTLAAIYAEALTAGLREICVVKHYSHELPNHADAWVNWKRTKPADFDAYLAEFAATPQPAGLRVLSGVETELVSAAGDINIPDAQAARVDLVLLSNHWLPDGPGLSRAWQPLLREGKLPGAMKPEDLGPWLEALHATGPEPYVRAVCDGNASALRRHPKVRVLAHLGDGLGILRAFRVPADDLSDDRLLELAEPVMQACCDQGALWELTPGIPRRTHIVREASRRGVAFTGTVDAHFLANPAWGHTLAQHAVVEESIRRLGVTRGRLAAR